ncbi:hypothetical protein SAMN05421827_101167 [Pedobacter terrae]|uniref:Uncharacterized protein n=1 Tax=Pedobacter terrae TaxID=405671 RepID=A0A1G7N0S6_9SPHI|nr:hypothetical protein [Pedobacter terrae]SDF67531.1 hypothetical protein SAMN05421827_101167 [Pedobacter terrae]
MIANHLANNIVSYLFKEANQIIRRFKQNDMRLISCVALLMVIPAIGLLTKADKFTDKKTPDKPVHERVANDSTIYTRFNQAGGLTNYEQVPIISTTDYRISYFKAAHPDSSPFFTINK